MLSTSGMCGAPGPSGAPLRLALRRPPVVPADATLPSRLCFTCLARRGACWDSSAGVTGTQSLGERRRLFPENAILLVHYILLTS